jgi:hypothetical protein
MRTRSEAIAAAIGKRDARILVLERENAEMRDEVQKCRNSVVEASLAFPNVGSYIAQIEKENAEMRTGCRNTPLK